MNPSLYPLISWDYIDDGDADLALEKWGHWLGACDRPFGRHSYGLFFGDSLVSVAVSASTAGTHCADYNRYEVVELARLCSHPEHRDMTRVALRLWRKVAARDWGWKFWPVVAYVSYANANRHTGDVYRFDGWRKVKRVEGGIATTGHQKGTTYEPKWIWDYRLPVTEEQRNEWKQARTDAVESARAFAKVRVPRRGDRDPGGGDAFPLFAERDAPPQDRGQTAPHRPDGVDSHRD